MYVNPLLHLVSLIHRYLRPSIYTPPAGPDFLKDAILVRQDLELFWSVEENIALPLSTVGVLSSAPWA